MIRVALYARVSTHDKDQNPETQLLRLRDYAAAQGWVVVDEYVDRASANDLLHRTRWSDLLRDAARRRFDLVLVFKLDRAFRSVKHMHDTLDAWAPFGIGFRSAQEGFDTGTALGKLLLNLLASLAEFELELIRECVAAGMERARRQGVRIGRPRIADLDRVRREWPAVRRRILTGDLSRRQAARLLGISEGSVRRLLRADGAHPGPAIRRSGAGPPGA